MVASKDIKTFIDLLNTLLQVFFYKIQMIYICNMVTSLVYLIGLVVKLYGRRQEEPFYFFYANEFFSHYAYILLRRAVIGFIMLTFAYVTVA